MSISEQVKELRNFRISRENPTFSMLDMLEKMNQAADTIESISAKLAELEDMVDVREKMCDEYCQYPCKCPNQETLDNICSGCELAKLFDVLDGIAPAQKN